MCDNECCPYTSVCAPVYVPEAVEKGLETQESRPCQLVTPLCIPNDGNTSTYYQMRWTMMITCAEGVHILLKDSSCHGKWSISTSLLLSSLTCQLQMISWTCQFQSKWDTSLSIFQGTVMTTNDTLQQCCQFSLAYNQETMRKGPPIFSSRLL